MLDRVRSRSDGGLTVAILAAILIGLISLGFGIWGLVYPPPEWIPVKVIVAPVGAVVAGLISIAFALYEFLHRLRHGPQRPGWHARPPR